MKYSLIFSPNHGTVSRMIQDFYAGFETYSHIDFDADSESEIHQAIERIEKENTDNEYYQDSVFALVDDNWNFCNEYLN